MRTLTLNGDWAIVERPLSDGPEAAAAVLQAAGALTGQVPGDVNDSLVRCGRLPEPLTALNFREFGWVKERSWWFRKSFAAPEGWRDAERVELALDGLDVHADVWLNGAFLGHHRSAFYPFGSDVTRLLRFGSDNVLLVRLTTGYERAPRPGAWPLTAAVPTEASRGYPDRGFQGRVYLRKPAYTWGWDWSPPLPTCGITGGAELRAVGGTEIRDVALVTRRAGGDAVVEGTLEIEHNTLVSSAWAEVSLTLRDEAGREFGAARRDVFLASGVNLVELRVVVTDPQWWWPNGSGGQPLYRVSARAVVDGRDLEAPPLLYGLRTVELVNEPGRFGFLINGCPVFMQGGNWVPCDALYGRITPAKVARLVEEAAAAGFNCLRIWGGGRFEMDAFYDACDRLGILVWHDFMSACAPLPAHEEWFADEFRREAEHQVRRLRSRACLLLWCGNNEVSACYEWMSDQFRDNRDPGWNLYHRLLPRLVHDLSPHVPYRPTSPYGGKDSLNDAHTGDDHHWVVMRPEPRFWSWPEYWDSPDRSIFNSEYGYGGPCCPESAREYLGAAHPRLRGDVAREHTNTFYNLERVDHSIREHYGEPSELALEPYLLRGGLCQGLNLGYSLESLRANGRTAGALFWMFADAWGENGWSIVDYYLRRKVSFYAVRRALAPLRLVLRRGGQAFGGRPDEVLLILLNDGPEAVAASVGLGYVSYDGNERELPEIGVAVPPRSRTVVGACPVPPPARLARGTVAAVPGGYAGLEPAAWRHCRFREMGLPPARLSLERTDAAGGDRTVTLRSETYAHAVHFRIPGDYRLSDHYFDLLPGETRVVTIYGGAGLDPRALTPHCVEATA